MSAMSFWIWPSLNGETSSAGASTREICVGRWSRQRTRASISICVQRLARHLAGTNGAVAQRSPACTSPGRFSAHRGASWDQARDPYQHPPSRPPRPPWPFSPPAHHAARHWGGVRPGTSGPGQGPQTHKTLTQAEGRRGQLDLFGLALEHRGHEAAPRRPGQAQGSSKGQISGIPYP